MDTFENDENQCKIVIVCILLQSAMFFAALFSIPFNSTNYNYDEDDLVMFASL